MGKWLWRQGQEKSTQTVEHRYAEESLGGSWHGYVKTTDIPNVIRDPCKQTSTQTILVGYKGVVYNFGQQCNGNFTPRYHTQEIVTNVYQKCEQPFSLQFCLWYKQYEARQAEGRKGVDKQKGHLHANTISPRSGYCINTEEFQVMLK